MTTPRLTRYGLLTRLAWDFSRIERSTVVVLPSKAQPVLYLSRSSGWKAAVIAIQHDNGRWFFMWGCGNEVDASNTEIAARRIAATIGA